MNAWGGWGRGVFKILTYHLRGGMRKRLETYYCSRCPGRDSNRLSSELKPANSRVQMNTIQYVTFKIVLQNKVWLAKSGQWTLRRTDTGVGLLCFLIADINLVAVQLKFQPFFRSLCVWPHWLWIPIRHLSEKSWILLLQQYFYYLPFGQSYNIFYEWVSYVWSVSSDFSLI
jgi:hypothetical protein